MIFLTLLFLLFFFSFLFCHCLFFFHFYSPSGIQLLNYFKLLLSLVLRIFQFLEISDYFFFLFLFFFFSLFFVLPGFFLLFLYFYYLFIYFLSFFFFFFLAFSFLVPKFSRHRETQRKIDSFPYSPRYQYNGIVSERDFKRND